MICQHDVLDAKQHIIYHFATTLATTHARGICHIFEFTLRFVVR